MLARKSPGKLHLKGSKAIPGVPSPTHGSLNVINSLRRQESEPIVDMGASSSDAVSSDDAYSDAENDYLAGPILQSAIDPGVYPTRTWPSAPCHAIPQATEA